jgi:hypothetical protein
MSSKNPSPGDDPQARQRRPNDETQRFLMACRDAYRDGLQGTADLDRLLIALRSLLRSKPTLTAALSGRLIAMFAADEPEACCRAMEGVALAFLDGLSLPAHRACLSIQASPVEAIAVRAFSAGAASPRLKVQVPPALAEKTLTSGDTSGVGGLDSGALSQALVVALDLVLTYNVQLGWDAPHRPPAAPYSQPGHPAANRAVFARRFHLPLTQSRQQRLEARLDVVRRFFTAKPDLATNLRGPLDAFHQATTSVATAYALELVAVRFFQVLGVLAYRAGASAEHLSLAPITVQVLSRGRSRPALRLQIQGAQSRRLLMGWPGSADTLKETFEHVSDLIVTHSRAVRL